MNAIVETLVTNWQSIVIIGTAILGAQFISAVFGIITAIVWGMATWSKRT